MTDESIAALSPTAAATSKLLKSGMTLTQVSDPFSINLENILNNDPGH